MIKDKKKSGMAKRYESSYAKRDGGGSSKGGVINYRKYDGEVKFFTPTEGKHRINIIPYVIKSKNHPLVKSGEAEIGEVDYVLDFYTHRNVGPGEKTVLCLKNTFGKPCPICEKASALRKAGKEKEANALKPSRRVVYNIEDLKEPGELKVFETSHYLFEKELIEEARDDDEGGFIDFADVKEGKEIKFRASKVTKNNMEFTEFKSFAFEDRDEELDQKLLKSAINFDELLEVPSYEEVEKILYGEDDEDDDEDEKPKKKSKHVDDDEDDEDDDDEDDEDDEPAPKSKKSKSKSDEDDEPEDDDDEDDEDDDDDEPKSKKSGKPKFEPVKKSKSKSDDDEEEDSEEDDEPAPKSKKSKSDEDDDEDDEPAPKKSSKKKSDDDEDEDDEDEKPKSKKKCDGGGDCSECPFGHRFGKDCEEFGDCDDCDIWDKCVKAN